MCAKSLSPIRTALAVFVLTAGAFGICPDALSEEVGGRLMLHVVPDAIHFDPSPDHAKRSWSVGGEYLWPNRWLAGFAYFNNSFDQKSQYIYGGRIWPLTDDASRYWYFKLTGGAVLGYRDPHDEKLPVNINGVGIGIIPGVGYQFGRFNVQVNLLGDAAVAVSFGYDLLR